MRTADEVEALLRSWRIRRLLGGLRVDGPAVARAWEALLPLIKSGQTQGSRNLLIISHGARCGGSHVLRRLGDLTRQRLANQRYERYAALSAVGPLLPQRQLLLRLLADELLPCAPPMTWAQREAHLSAVVDARRPLIISIDNADALVSAQRLNSVLETFWDMSSVARPVLVLAVRSGTRSSMDEQLGDVYDTRASVEIARISTPLVTHQWTAALRQLDGALELARQEEDVLASNSVAVHVAMEGRLGALIDVLQVAGLRAIESGSEQVTIAEVIGGNLD